MIISNKARCRKCEDIIESKHRHDFVRCKCGAIAVDGGKEYIRRAFINRNDIEELSEYDDKSCPKCHRDLIWVGGNDHEPEKSGAICYHCDR